jgi:hypothetical protein
LPNVAAHVVKPEPIRRKTSDRTSSFAGPAGPVIGIIASTTRRRPLCAPRITVDLSGLMRGGVTRLIAQPDRPAPFFIGWQSVDLFLRQAASFADRDESAGLYSEGLSSELLSTLRKALSNKEHIRSVSVAGSQYVLCTDRQIYYDNIPKDLEATIVAASRASQIAPEKSIGKIYIAPQDRWLVINRANGFSTSDGMPKLTKTLQTVRDAGQEIRCAAFSESGWCFSGGGYGYKYLAVPQAFLDSLADLFSKQSDISYFALSRTYGWIIIEGKNRYRISKGIPKTMERALLRMQDTGRKVELVALDSESGWLVVGEP